MASSGPTFRWDLLAFIAMVVAALVVSTALLVLLDPRSQVWWGDRFSELGTLVRALLDAALGRG